MKEKISALKSLFNKTIPELEAAVHADLKHGRYKEAIATFKDLLKRETRRDWEEALADTYLKRATQVAAKGMYQEAALLWENHAKLRPGTVVSETYLEWLVRAGQPVKMTQVLGRLPETVARTPLGQRITEAVAILALENDSLLGQLPGDHAIIRQQPLAKQAVTAYSAGRDSEASDALQQIPSRSPYRNLRTLLKALLVLPTDQAAAMTLDRVEADSFCQPVARAVKDYVASDFAAPDGYFALSPKQQTLINTLNGYSKAQTSLLRDIYRAVAAKSSQSILEVVLKYRAELGDAMTRRFCLATLIATYPDGIPLFERAFGKLPPFEVHRIRALHAEEKHDHDQARRYWSQYLKVLKQGTAEREPLVQAAVMRHLATMRGESDADESIELLTESLVLDPDDKASYLALIKLGEKLDNTKLVQTWLDRFIERYPHDPEGLALAMRAANRRKAFKKAAGYARTLLDIDPINSQARRFLLDAHLSHARKQLKAKRPHLVRRELAEARVLDPQQRNPAPLFVEGLVAYQEGQHTLAAQWLQKALVLAGEGLVAQFQLAMEILVAGLNLRDLLRLVSDSSKNRIATPAELMALIKMIGQYREESRQNLAQALQNLKPVLKKSFQQAALSDEDRFGLCQSFADVALYDLVTECTKPGLQRPPFAPGLVYFDVLARCKGDASKLRFQDIPRLQSAIHTAKQSGNHRVTALIISFMEKFEESRFPDFPDFGDDLFSMPEGMPEMPPELAALGPEKLLKFVMKGEEIEEMSRQELIAYLSAGKSPLRFVNLSESQLRSMALEKLFEEALANGPPLNPFGGQGRQR